jgi:hypothetical protein
VYPGQSSLSAGAANTSVVLVDSNECKADLLRYCREKGISQLKKNLVALQCIDDLDNVSTRH